MFRFQFKRTFLSYKIEQKHLDVLKFFYNKKNKHISYKTQYELFYSRIYRELFSMAFNFTKKKYKKKFFSFFVFFFLRSGNFLNFFKFNKKNIKDVISERFYLVKLKKRIRYFTWKMYSNNSNFFRKQLRMFCFSKDVYRFLKLTNYKKNRNSSLKKKIKKKFKALIFLNYYMSSSTGAIGSTQPDTLLNNNTVMKGLCAALDNLILFYLNN